MPGRVVPIVSVAFLIWWPWSKLQVKSFRISEINYIKTKNSGLVILGWKSNLPEAHTRQINKMVIKVAFFAIRFLEKILLTSICM